MVRGHAKEQARAKAQVKQAKAAGGSSQLGTARQQGLKFTCPQCMLQVPGYKVLESHFASKHPKDTLPTEESFKT